MTLAYLACKMNLCSYINSHDQYIISKYHHLNIDLIKIKLPQKITLRNLQKTIISPSVIELEAFLV